MKKLILTALLGLGVSGAALAQPGDAAAGEAKIAVCVACHGQSGNTVTIPGAAKIGGQNFNYLFKQLQDIRDGARPVPLMAGMLNNSSDQDLADMAAFYAAQERGEGAAEESALELGARLYRAGDASIGVAPCSACHSPTGLGNAGAGYPMLSGQDPAYTEAQLRAYRSGERDNDIAGVMRSIVARLNDQEISALASYISGLRP